MGGDLSHFSHSNLTIETRHFQLSGHFNLFEFEIGVVKVWPKNTLNTEVTNV